MSQSYIGHELEPEAAKYHHGRSPAAWVGVLIAGVGFVLGCVAVILLDWTMLIVAGAILVLSLLVTVAMRAAGLGNA